MTNPGPLHTATPLPRRPRLVPGLHVLERGNGDLQFGLDPAYGVIVRNSPHEFVDILRSLDGSRHIDSLLSSKIIGKISQLRQLLAALTTQGLLEEGEPPVREPRTAHETNLWSLRARQNRTINAELASQISIVLHGNGRLTIAMATLLAQFGIGRVHVETTGRVTQRDLGCGYVENDLGTSRRGASIRLLRRINPSTNTAPLYGHLKPDLVLLADAIVPAPEVVRLLTHEGVPHLPVRIREGIGIIGPLVIPGRTSCLHCADLHRTTLDPSWPIVAGQLAGRTQTADLVTVNATAAFGVNQVLQILLSQHNSVPRVWNATVEIDIATGQINHRNWEPHPHCFCGAHFSPNETD